MIIPGGEAASCAVRAGQLLHVIDLEGCQVADFVAFNAADLRERSSPAETISFNLTLRLPVGACFYSNRGNPMFEIADDTTGGVHDLLHAACSGPLFEHLSGERGRSNCRDNLAAAMLPYGVDRLDVPDPINLFQYTWPTADGTLEERPGSTKPGGRVVLRACTDCVVAVSACPYDLTVSGASCIGDGPTPIGLEITGPGRARGA